MINLAWCHPLVNLLFIKDMSCRPALGWVSDLIEYFFFGEDANFVCENIWLTYF